MRRVVLPAVGVALLGALLGWAGDWPQFRGPGADNLSTEAALPHEWGLDQNLAWKAEIPGKGWSSPIVWGGRVFVTTAVVEKPQKIEERRLSGGVFRWEVYCLDLTTGKVLWRRVARRGKPRIATHTSNTYASETPVTDGQRLYVYFGMTGLYCYDFDGKLFWEKDLGAYRMQGDWGTATSPVLHGGLLFMQIDSEEASFLAALDAETGKESWRVPRDEGSNWSTPVVWKTKSRTELVTSGQTVRSYDPATGELLWKLGIGGGRCTASATVDGEMLYVGSEERRDGGGYLYAVRAGASGDITPAEGESASDGVIWKQANAGPPMSSPLIYEGYVYILERRNGIVTCYDAKTGKRAYRKRLQGAQAFWATPFAHGGKVFCVDDTGTTHLLQPGSEFRVLARNSLGDDQFWASPAIAGGSIIFRGLNYLYCVRK